MLKKLGSKVSKSAIEKRSKDLKELSKTVKASMMDLGFAEAGCKTVCEERLVVVNGKLQHEVVCHTVCP